MTEARADGINVFNELMPGLLPDDVTNLRDGGFADELAELTFDHVFSHNLGTRGWTHGDL
jgi:4-carboxymuconolactone decarboxylase